MTDVIENYDCNNDHYPEFSEILKQRVNATLGNGIPLFMTDATGLFELFLNNLPAEGRQHYNCRNCGHFVDRFGGLVTLSDKGEITPLIWNEKDIPEFFTSSVKAIKNVVLKSKITGIFLSENKTLGVPTTGEWHHMSATLPSAMVFKSRTKTAHQEMAEKKEEFKMLIAGLLEFSVETVDQALNILKSEALYRSDKFLGVAEWLKDLHTKRTNAKNSSIRNNITWLAVAKAPDGFCHIKSSMIGTLLEDIAANLSFDSVKNRFAAKTNPSTYMRAQTAPSQGNIQQAEKLIEQLGLDLRRRYATFEEIPFKMWENNHIPKKNVEKAGVFGKLTPKNSTTVSNEAYVPSTIMTWDKFQRTILPSAENIEARVENTNRLMALVTASDETSENILQWDNPFSWYYHGGIDGEIKRRVENAGGKYENNEIRCSLIWEGYTDLDLHCITPSGEHLFFGTNGRTSRCRGNLDVDANGGGPQTIHPVENMRWSERALIGNYKFYVHNFCERGKGSTPFKVELEINGKIYSYNGIAGTTGYKTDVFTFNYAKGLHPNIENANSHSSSDAWNIPVNGFAKVKGITNSPNLWGEDKSARSGHHIFFLLDGCKDLSEGKGRGFFVETLKSELHGVRKTLEAYSAITPIEDVDRATACGVGYSKDSEWNLTLKVTSNNSTRIIKIDRWD